MNYKNLCLTVLALGGIYGQSHSMDMKAWQAELYQAIVEGSVERLKTCMAQDTTFHCDHQYEAAGYKLPDGRFFVKAENVEGMGAATAIKIFSPLNLACKSNQLEIVRFFVEEHNAVINGPADDNSVLLTACNKMNVDIVQYLLSKGAQVSPAWIVDGEASIQGMAQDHRDRHALQRVLHLLKDGKIVCGVPMTRLNVGIMIAGIAVCAAVGKYGYDRYRASGKKSALDDETDAQDKQEASLGNQSGEHA